MSHRGALPLSFLLFPTFYPAKGLEGRLPRIVGDWLADQPQWLKGSQAPTLLTPYVSIRKPVIGRQQFN